MFADCESTKCVTIRRYWCQNDEDKVRLDKRHED